MILQSHRLAVSFAFLCSLFMLVVPLATMARYQGQFDIFKLAVIFIINLMALVIFVFLVANSQAPQRHDPRLNISLLRASLLTVACFFPLVIFIVKNVAVFDLPHFVSFSQAYRQGVFSGSGVYTLWVTQVLPFIVVILFLSGVGYRVLLFPLVVCVLSSMLLGLRIFLWGIVVTLFIYLLYTFTIKRILIALIGVALFVGYKLYVGAEQDVSLPSLIVAQLTRPDLHAIVKPDLFADNFTEFFEYLPFLRLFYGHGHSSFKQFYISSIENFELLMPHVSLVSGVALPGHVMAFNFFGFFSLFVSAVSLAIIFYLLWCAIAARNSFKKTVFVYLFVVSSGAFLEDLGMLYKLEEGFILVPLVYFALIFVSGRSFVRQCAVDR
jgi:hypothetical protein